MEINPWLKDRTPTVVSLSDKPVRRMADGLGFNWYSWCPLPIPCIP